MAGLGGPGAASQQPAHFKSPQHGQIQVENDEVGRARGDRFERGISAADDLGLRSAATLQCVLDQTGDVLFVFDDQHPRLLHVSDPTVLAGGFAAVSELSNLSYMADVWRAILRAS